MAACSIFEEDEVSVKGDKGFKCGLVVESSEYVSSDEEEDPQFNYQRVRKGLVRVAWHPDGEEEVVQEKKVRAIVMEHHSNSIQWFDSEESLSPTLIQNFLIPLPFCVSLTCYLSRLLFAPVGLHDLEIVSNMYSTRHCHLMPV